MLRAVLLLVFVTSFQARPGCDAGWQPSRNRNNNKEETFYAILIDGGSTGSKMFIYKIALNQRGKVDAVSDLEELKNTLGKVKPGLSSLMEKEISPYLEKFIDEAKRIVPEDKWKSTPILVLATAGMRLLPQADQYAIMNEVGGLID